MQQQYVLCLCVFALAEFTQVSAVGRSLKNGVESMGLAQVEEQEEEEGDDPSEVSAPVSDPASPPLVQQQYLQQPAVPAIVPEEPEEQEVDDENSERAPVVGITSPPVVHQQFLQQPAAPAPASALSPAPAPQEEKEDEKQGILGFKWPWQKDSAASPAAAPPETEKKQDAATPQPPQADPQLDPALKKEVAKEAAKGDAEYKKKHLKGEPKKLLKGEPWPPKDYRTCNPPCINGRGICNDNICFCKSPYSGTTCQHEINALTNVSYPIAMIFYVISAFLGILMARFAMWMWTSNSWASKKFNEAYVNKEIWTPPEKKAGAKAAAGAKGNGK